VVWEGGVVVQLRCLGVGGGMGIANSLSFLIDGLVEKKEGRGKIPRP